MPGKPSKGSAIQLPGKVFTHFQDWSSDPYSMDQQQRSLSAYYCHSFFDAITAGGCCWVLLSAALSQLMPPCPSPPAGKLQAWEGWVWLVHSHSASGADGITTTLLLLQSGAV